MRILALLVPAFLSSAVLAQDHRLTSVRLEGEVLRLSVTTDVEPLRHFPLPNPPRVVLDLFGLDRSIAEMPAPPTGSPALDVRTGEHAGFLRLVVDLHETLPSYEVRRSDGMIEVGLGPSKLPPSQTGALVGPSAVPGNPAAPPQESAPVVAIGVESAPSDDTAASTAAQPVVATPSAVTAAGADTRSLDDLTTDELLALIEAELAAAGHDQQQSAEELIEQVEAELEANDGTARGSNTGPPRETPPVQERSVRRAPPRRPRPAPAEDNGPRPAFRFIDEEPAEEPPAEDGDPDGDQRR